MGHLLRIRQYIFFIILFTTIVCSGVIVSCNLIDSSPDLVYTMVNVNNTKLQGDAHVIKVKNGKIILIDAGYLGPAKEKLVPFLKKSHIDKIDIAFISHPHRDHYEGLLPILNAGIKIKDVYFNIPDKEICDREIPWGCEYKDILTYHQILKDYDVQI